MFCPQVAGEDNPSKGSIEKTKTTKADLVAALKDAVAYCNKTFDCAMTDATGSEMVQFHAFHMGEAVAAFAEYGAHG